MDRSVLVVLFLTALVGSFALITGVGQLLAFFDPCHSFGGPREGSSASCPGGHSATAMTRGAAVVLLLSVQGTLVAASAVCALGALRAERRAVAVAAFMYVVVGVALLPSGLGLPSLLVGLALGAASLGIPHGGSPVLFRPALVLALLAVLGLLVTLHLGDAPLFLSGIVVVIGLLLVGFLRLVARPEGGAPLP